MRIVILFVLLFCIVAQPAYAGTKKGKIVKKYQDKLAEKIKKKNPNFTGFTIEEGKKFYFSEHLHSKKNKLRSCATCHNKDATTAASHATTGKDIKPLAPSANRKRFTKVKKIKKWFKRNCKWVVERPCTAQEQGDFIEYIYSL